jgi:hypothetical protein
MARPCDARYVCTSLSVLQMAVRFRGVLPFVESPTAAATVEFEVDWPRMRRIISRLALLSCIVVVVVDGYS